MDENKGNQNKEHVLNEMNDYISSTMSIPVIKLDDNNNMINKPETTDHSEVTEIYSTTVSEEKSDLGREMFAAPTPAAPIEEAPVAEEVKMEAPTPQPVVEEPKVEEPKVEEKNPVVEETKPEISSMNSIEQTHVDFKEPPVKKKSKFPVVAGVLVLLIALGALGYFVIYPMIQRKFMSNPKNVFEATIKENVKNVNAMIDNVPVTNALYDINFKFNANISELSPFTKYTYGVRSGIDLDKKALEASLYMIDENNTNYYFNAYVKDGKTYGKFSSRDQLIDLGAGASEEEINQAFEQIQELLSEVGMSNEDMEYLVTKVSDLFIESLDEKKLSQEKASINFNGTSVSVEKNSYVMDSENYQRTVKFILEGLEKDEKANKILSELLGTDVKSFREAFENEKVEMPTIKINIYTAGKKKDVIGYNIEVDGKEILYYYFDDKGFEFKINDVTFNEGVEVTAATNMDLRVTGVKDGDKTNISVKLDNEEVATIQVKKWDEKGIDLTYVINAGEQKVNGALKVSIDKGNNYKKINIVFSVETGSDRLSVEMNINTSVNTKIADVDTSTAIVPSDAELDMILNEFIGSLSNTPIGALFGSLSGMYDSDVDGQLNQYYDQNAGTNPLDDNSYITA